MMNINAETARKYSAEYYKILNIAKSSNYFQEKVQHEFLDIEQKIEHAAKNGINKVKYILHVAISELSREICLKVCEIDNWEDYLSKIFVNKISNILIEYDFKVKFKDKNKIIRLNDDRFSTSLEISW